MHSQIVQNEESYRAAFGRENCYLLIMGESGYECYLSCPFSQIKTSLDALSLLMHDLEALSWNDHLYEGRLSDVSTAAYEAHLESGQFQPGDYVERGEITTSLWLSPCFSKFEIDDQVRNVLHGEASRIKLNRL